MHSFARMEHFCVSTKKGHGIRVVRDLQIGKLFTNGELGINIPRVKARTGNRERFNHEKAERNNDAE